MADDMSVSELKIAVNAANGILEMLSEGKKLERWQISKIVLASDFLASVCTNMRADVHLEEEEEDESEEDDEPENQFLLVDNTDENNEPKTVDILVVP